MNMKKKVFELNNKKMLIGILVGIIIVIVILTAVLYSGKNRTIDYKGLKSMIDNGETFVVYYYNNKSSNLKNLTIKKHLYKKGIKYYLYDDAKMNKNDYKKLLNLLNLDSKVFGPPSIIYIKDGRMYGNIINIDSNRVVDKFIDNYDLYTVK